MKKEDLIVIYLSVLVAWMQWGWMQAEKRAAYLEGRASVFNEFAASDSDGTCYAQGGCEPHQLRKGK